ncbi:hypothetical protein GC177_04470 [bacterium]|nr:hypothetical protein [bacterium]
MSETPIHNEETPPVAAPVMEEASTPPKPKKTASLWDACLFAFIFAAVLVGGLYGREAGWHGFDWNNIRLNLQQAFKLHDTTPTRVAAAPASMAEAASPPLATAEVTLPPEHNRLEISPPLQPVPQIAAEEATPPEQQMQGPALPVAAPADAPSQSGRDEGLSASSWQSMVSLQRALLNGQPYYEPLWNMKRSLPKDHPLVSVIEALEPQAGTGIPKFIELQREFSVFATPLASALRIREDTPYWLAPLRHIAVRMLSWRRVADAGNTPDAAVDAMSEALRMGDMAAIKNASDRIGAYIHVRNNDAGAVQRYMQWHESMNSWLTANTNLQQLMDMLQSDAIAGVKS